jgi:hypothetical protein
MTRNQQPAERVKLSHPMRAMLRNLATGRRAYDGLVGRSAHGGAEWTMQTLLKRGLVAHTPLYGAVITEAGRAAIKEPT